MVTAGVENVAVGDDAKGTTGVSAVALDAVEMKSFAVFYAAECLP